VSHNKYNTVTGNTAGSQVWIVYENGRAYPDYLVRFYRNARDPARTPFASRADAGPLRKGTPPPLRQPSPAPAPPAPQPQPLPAGWDAHVDPNTGAEFYVNTATGASQWNKPVMTSNPLHAAPAVSGVWEFDDGGTWRQYEQAAQRSLEDAWVVAQQRPGVSRASMLPPGAIHVYIVESLCCAGCTTLSGARQEVRPNLATYSEQCVRLSSERPVTQGKI
jgi:hypothetical protein